MNFTRPTPRLRSRLAAVPLIAVLLLAGCNLPIGGSGRPKPATPIPGGGEIQTLTPSPLAPESAEPGQPPAPGETTPGPEPTGAGGGESGGEAGGGGPDSGGGREFPTEAAPQDTPASSAQLKSPAEPTPGMQIFLPQVSQNGAGPRPAAGPGSLAFLKAGDLWLAEAAGAAPRALTQGAGLLSFAWSGDGSRLAAFDGKQVCFLGLDGQPAAPCLALGFSGAQAAVARRLAWSPDGKWLVVWNPVNPSDEGELGWLVVPIKEGVQSKEMIRISDPVDWGASLAPNNEPGGLTGQPLFLPDGSLIGALSHRYLCGSGGCQYAVFRFVLPEGGVQPSFTPLDPNSKASFTQSGNLSLSPGGAYLAAYGAFHTGCDTYTTYVDVLGLANRAVKDYTFDQQEFTGLALAPGGQQAIAARTVGCSSENKTQWSQACGLSDGFDVLPMQSWDLVSGTRADLLPGLDPAFASDGGMVAFTSCLASGAAGAWQPSASAKPSVYIMDPAGKQVTLVSEGIMPRWRP